MVNTQRSDNKPVDVVVVGSRASGLATAYTAAEFGLSVIVFEKQRSLGGSSNFFEGTFAVESKLQRKSYITYSRDEAFHNFSAFAINFGRLAAKHMRTYLGKER